MLITRFISKFLPGIVCRWLSHFCWVRSQFRAFRIFTGSGMWARIFRIW